jgi:hypothetical protein
MNNYLIEVDKDTYDESPTRIPNASLETDISIGVDILVVRTVSVEIHAPRVEFGVSACLEEAGYGEGAGGEEEGGEEVHLGVRGSDGDEE